MALPNAEKALKLGEATSRLLEAREHTAKIEGEFLGMLDGMLVEPAQVRVAERARCWGLRLR